MTLLDVGLASVFVFNALFLLLCTYMAWRMLRHMRDSREDMGALAHSLRSQATLLNRTAGETLETFGNVRKEMHRLLEVARVGLAGRGGGSSGGDPYQDWAQRDPKGLNDLIGRQGGLLEDVQKIDAERFVEWRRSKQTELERLLMQKNRVQQEFEKLRAAHEETQLKLRDQEFRTRAHQRAAAEAGTLKEEVEQLRRELQKAQDRARKSEVENCELAASLDRQKARNGQGPEVAAEPAGHSAALREMADQLAEAEADRQRLRHQLEQIQDNLKRTLTEKDFIEDKFMELDASQGGAAAKDETLVEA